MAQNDKTEYMQLCQMDDDLPMSGETFEKFVEFGIKYYKAPDFNKSAYEYAMQEQYNRLQILNDENCPEYKALSEKWGDDFEYFTDMQGRTPDEIMNDHIQNVLSGDIQNKMKNTIFGQYDFDAFTKHIDHNNFVDFMDSASQGVVSYLQFVKEENLIGKILDNKRNEQMPDWAKSLTENHMSLEEVQRKFMMIPTPTATGEIVYINPFTRMASTDTDKSVVKNTQDDKSQQEDYTESSGTLASAFHQVTSSPVAQTIKDKLGVIADKIRNAVTKISNTVMDKITEKRYTEAKSTLNVSDETAASDDLSFE